MCCFFLLWLGEKMNIFSVRGKNSEAENLHKAGKLQMLKQKQTNKKRITSLPKEKKQNKLQHTQYITVIWRVWRPLFFLYETGRLRPCYHETHHYGLQEQENILRQEGHWNRRQKKQHLRSFNKCAGLMTHCYTQVVECWGEFTLAVRIKGLPRVSLQGLGVFW